MTVPSQRFLDKTREIAEVLNSYELPFLWANCAYHGDWENFESSRTSELNITIYEEILGESNTSQLESLLGLHKKIEDNLIDDEAEPINYTLTYDNEVDRLKKNIERYKGVLEHYQKWFAEHPIEKPKELSHAQRARQEARIKEMFPG